MITEVPPRPNYKYCPRCAEYKRVTDFNREKGRPDGLNGWCRECRKASAEKKRRKKTLESKKSHPRPMTGEQFQDFHKDNGWLFRYIGSAAAKETQDPELRADLRQEAWIRLSFCQDGLDDDVYRQVVDRAVHQAYMKVWRAKKYEVDGIENMTRDEYAMWMTGIYLP